MTRDLRASSDTRPPALRITCASPAYNLLKLNSDAQHICQLSIERVRLSLHLKSILIISTASHGYRRPYMQVNYGTRRGQSIQFSRGRFFIIDTFITKDLCAPIFSPRNFSGCSLASIHVTIACTDKLNHCIFNILSTDIPRQCLSKSSADGDFEAFTACASTCLHVRTSRALASSATGQTIYDGVQSYVQKRYIWSPIERTAWRAGGIGLSPSLNEDTNSAFAATTSVYIDMMKPYERRQLCHFY